MIYVTSLEGLDFAICISAMSFAILSLICSNDQRKRGIRVQYCMWAAWGWAWVGIYIMTCHMTYNDFKMYRQQCPDGKRKQHQFKKDYNETQPSYVKQTVAWGHRSGQRRMGTVKSRSSCTWCATSWHLLLCAFNERLACWAMWPHVVCERLAAPPPHHIYWQVNKIRK